jgi:UDP-glucose 4-epimerase
VRGDLLNLPALSDAAEGIDVVFHLAANADVRFGARQPRRDLEQNTIATHNVLEVMREKRIEKIVFASTGSIYGEATVIPTPEDAPFPVQTSLYAASKLACEGMITAYCEAFGMSAHIFRFVSILGERYTHGHVVDFVRQLKVDPSKLHVLGDGKQRKSYLHIGNCIEGMLVAFASANQRVNIFNLGHDDYCEVNESIKWICQALNVRPAISYSGGDRGWVGDNPFIHLDIAKMRKLGWRPTLTIRESVLTTVAYLTANSWLLDARTHG